MARRGRELRHIVDVDGQLIGIDAEAIDAATLLGRAGRDAGMRLFVVRNGLRTMVAPHQRVRLREDEVAFFETDADLMQHLPTTTVIQQLTV